MNTFFRSNILQGSRMSSLTICRALTLTLFNGLQMIPRRHAFRWRISFYRSIIQLWVIMDYAEHRIFWPSCAPHGARTMTMRTNNCSNCCDIASSVKKSRAPHRCRNHHRIHGIIYMASYHSCLFQWIFGDPFRKMFLAICICAASYAT